MDPVAIFKALGHPQRYTLFLDLLGRGDSSCGKGVGPEEGACCVVDLTSRHSLSQSTISHHLRILVDAGIVMYERRGTYHIYRVNEAAWKEFCHHVQEMIVCSSSDQRVPVGRISTEEAERVQMGFLTLK